MDRGTSQSKPDGRGMVKERVAVTRSDVEIEITYATGLKVMGGLSGLKIGHMIRSQPWTMGGTWEVGIR